MIKAKRTHFCFFILSMTLLQLFITGCKEIGPGSTESDTFRVTYNGNGADYGTVPIDSTEYTEGSTVTVLQPGTLSRSGHSFIEWNTTIDGSGNAYESGSTLTMPDEDIVLYAQWMFTNGVLDASFSGDGIAVFDLTEDDVAYAMTLDDSGNVFFTGLSDDGANADFITIKLLSNGSIDGTFGTDGMSIIEDPSGSVADETGYAIARDDSGNLIITGISGAYAGAIRLDQNGTWDTSFGTGGGILISDVDYSNTTANAMCYDNDGNILIAGSLDYDIEITESNWVTTMGMAIWKFTGDGQAVSDFGTDGVALYLPEPGGDLFYRARSITVDSSGNIYATGYVSEGTDRDIMIWKYDSAGQIDSDFGDEGVILKEAVTGYDGRESGSCVIVDTDGGIIVLCNASNGTDYDIILMKFNSEGTSDVSFGDSGKVIYANPLYSDGSESASCCAIDTDGNIYLAGSIQVDSEYRMAIIKYTKEGVLYSGFGDAGTAVFNNSLLTGINDSHAYWITVISPTEIFASGYVYDGTNCDMAVWKYQ